MAKTTKPIIRIHDVELDEIIDREMTDIEFAEYQKDQEKAVAKRKELEAKAEAKQAIADRLGLTADELKLLLG